MNDNRCSRLDSISNAQVVAVDFGVNYSLDLAGHSFLIIYMYLLFYKDCIKPIDQFFVLYLYVFLFHVQDDVSSVINPYLHTCGEDRGMIYLSSSKLLCDVSELSELNSLGPVIYYKMQITAFYVSHVLHQAKLQFNER